MIKPKVVLGITGASGMKYALKMIDFLHDKSELCVVYTRAAKLVIEDEENITVERVAHSYKDVSFFEESDFSCIHASGSQKLDAVVVCPCSVATLASVANGLSSNLLERICDVALKERKKLVLVVRETPLSLVHVENMKKVILSGGIILPACPGFYNKPQSVEDIVDFVVSKVLNTIGFENNLLKPWSAS